MALRISIFLSIFMTVHGDTIRLTAKPNSQSYIFYEYGAPTDRIIITAAKTEDLVRLRIQSPYNLSEEDCATSAVKVTSGKAGLYVGSYCGKQTPDWFYASHNTEAIVFRSSKVAAGLGVINVTYDIHNWFICSGEILAYHHPRYIRSPQYPLTFRNQSCFGGIAGLNNERVSITVKSATLSTIDCSTRNLTIVDVYGGGICDAHIYGHWCGGPDKIYFSHWSLLHILAVVEQHPSAGFEIEYTAIPDPQRPIAPIVIISLEPKATPEVIMSPGPLNIYSKFRKLRWAGYSQQRVVVNITLLNASMEHTRACDTDSIRIYLDSDLVEDPLGLMWCGGDLPSYEVFTSRLLVVFRANPSTETHKGFSLQYRILDTSTLGGNLTATESVQHLMTPNYPGPYQGHQKCQWLIRTTDLFKVVKLTFTNTVLISNCTSESVRIYDGTNEQARAIADRCRYNRQNDNTYRSETSFMLIVFTSIIDNKDRSGFKASYVEESCGYTLEAVHGRRYVLNSPGYPGNYSSGGNCTWTIAGKAVAFRFIDMNIPCSGDSITFSDRGSTELKSKWEICGNKAHNYITTGNSMSINFVTTTGRGAGFKLTYERLHTGALTGCAGDVRQVTVTLYKRTIRIVGYPTGYFDDLHCRWLFKARHGGDRIKISFTIADINTDGSTCTDAIRVYDGSNSTARRLEEGCSSRRFSLKSTGRSLYVEFVTDSVNVGSGFVMQYSSLYVQNNAETSQPYKTPLIATGCLIGAVIIVVIACLSKRRRANSRRTAIQSQGMHTPAPSSATGTASKILQVYR